jgi:hypothetical protein
MAKPGCPHRTALARQPPISSLPKRIRGAPARIKTADSLRAGEKDKLLYEEIKANSPRRVKPIFSLTKFKSEKLGEGC